jgi:hypothetical protein
MYRLHLDLHWVVSPMGEHGRGITFTRELELPFPAHDGLRLHSRQMDECSEPLGYELKEVIWDMDRGVFLAKTRVIDQDLPLAMLEDQLRGWLAMGWRLGSYVDAYPEPEIDEEEDEALGDAIGDDADEYVLPTLPPRRRPAEFNRIFKALVRHMAEGFDCWDVAYAMDRTGRYFTEEQRKQKDDPAVGRWHEALREFDKLPQDEQFRWREKVMRYRSFTSVPQYSHDSTRPTD